MYKIIKAVKKVHIEIYVYNLKSQKYFNITSLRRAAKAQNIMRLFNFDVICI